MVPVTAEVVSEPAATGALPAWAVRVVVEALAVVVVVAAVAAVVVAVVVVVAAVAVGGSQCTSTIQSRPIRRTMGWLSSNASIKNGVPQFRSGGPWGQRRRRSQTTSPGLSRGVGTTLGTEINLTSPTLKRLNMRPINYSNAEGVGSKQ